MELDTCCNSFEPADTGLEGIQALEFYPDNLVQSRTLNKLKFASVLREIVDFDAIVLLTGAPETHISTEAYPGAFSSRWILRGHVPESGADHEGIALIANDYLIQNGDNPWVPTAFFEV